MKKIISIVLAFATVLLFSMTPVYASTNTEVCEKWKKQLETEGITDPNYDTLCKGSSNNEGEVQDRVQNILNTVFLWAGIIAAIVVVVGGILYVTSQGDPAKTARAKMTILYAVIGLIVVLLSYAIVYFITSNV